MVANPDGPMPKLAPREKDPSWIIFAVLIAVGIPALWFR
jgi:hypothetical protein